MLLWDRIAPPASVDSAWSCPSLIGAFANGRLFSDDEPAATLARQGIDRADLSEDADRNLFPAAPS